jgi:hypothetical protein
MNTGHKQLVELHSHQIIPPVYTGMAPEPVAWLEITLPQHAKLMRAITMSTTATDRPDTNHTRG